MRVMSFYAKQPMPKYAGLTALLLIIITLILFQISPQWDVESATYFHVAGNTFLWSNTAWANTLRHELYDSVALIMAVMIVLGILAKWKPTWQRRVRWQTALFVVLSFALGPGLVVNAILKNHWGRPRPHQITQLGGTMHFEPAGTPGGQCPTNCSFVCGDASEVFAFWAFLPFIRRRWRRISYGILILAAGSFMGLVRMAQGGHFLSDVILSGLVVYLVIWLLHRAFKKVALVS